MLIDATERARRALTRVPPSYPVNDDVVTDVATAIRDSVRAALLEASQMVAGRTYEGLELGDAMERRRESQSIAAYLDKLARQFA
jgi:hypothetical protein